MEKVVSYNIRHFMIVLFGRAEEAAEIKLPFSIDISVISG